MAFNPTDLPCPVAPATSMWGAFARSTMKTSLVMVFPKATGSSNVVSWNFLLFNIELIDTMRGLAFGTSIPMVPLPGIGAMIRMPSAERLRAMSSSKLRMRLMRTPSAGVISYNVTVGPTLALMELISMPKLRNTWMIRSLLAFCSCISMAGVLSLYELSRSSVGKW